MTDTTRFTGSRGLRASVSYRHLERGLPFRLFSCWIRSVGKLKGNEDLPY